MINVMVYPSMKVHMSPMEPREDALGYYRTVCGLEVLGYISDDYEVTCQRCLKGFEKGRQTYLELERRFGPK